jgi:hypothetical protein
LAWPICMHNRECRSGHPRKDSRWYRNEYSVVDRLAARIDTHTALR